ncbi:uncharacterized protein OCT59_001516 [Rhizophagus irregularis]|nr:hypothetical protein OCT59_001516 [Rhizophagus irregularis]
MYEKIALQVFNIFRLELSLKIMHYFIILLEMYARSRNKAKFASIPIRFNNLYVAVAKKVFVNNKEYKSTLSIRISRSKWTDLLN